MAIARARQHEFGVKRMDGDFTVESALEIADRREGAPAVAADAELSAGGGINHVAIGRMKGGPAADVTAELSVIEQAPVAAAIFGEVRAAHIAIEQHQVRISGRNSRRKHGAAARETQGLPGMVEGRWLRVEGGRLTLRRVVEGSWL